MWPPVAAADSVSPRPGRGCHEQVQAVLYVVVSRDFIAGNDDVSTVIRAPVYSELLGLRSEVPVGVEDGMPRLSSIRCDFMMLMFKRKLTQYVATLASPKQQALQRALRHALQVDA